MIGKYRATALYYYDSTIRTYLYQFKGCFDYELYPVFLNFIADYYHIHYHGYVIIPVPSYSGDDEIRGFNHVEWIFSLLKIKMMKVLIKTEHHKQANVSIKERKDIVKYMKVKDNIDLTGQKVLVVDDVYTTGNTMKTCIKLIEDLHPKKIEVLVLSMTT